MLDVAFCDDDKEDQTQFLPHIGQIVSAMGYRCDVLPFDDLGNLHGVLKQRPHIVFIDNKFGKDVNHGITFIARFKTEYPETLFVLLTGATFDLDQLALRRPNPDLIVTKNYLKVEEYRTYVSGRLGQLLSRYPMQSVFHEGGEDFTVVDQPLTHVELKALIEQLIHEGRLERERETPQARLRKLSGGYSGALVLEMVLTGKTLQPAVPTVVKIAPVEWMRNEYDAFCTYVRLQLPHTLRVDIVGTAAVKKFGAICYAFVLAGDSAVQPVSALLKKKRSQIVARVVKEIFASENTGWYRRLESDETFTDHLANRPEFAPERDPKRDEALRSSMLRVSKKDGIAFSVADGETRLGNLAISSLRRSIFRKNLGGLVECVCHGDLNANNIFTNGAASRLGLIDFSNSGRNPVFRDFISFETSIMLDWAMDAAEETVPIDQLFAHEISLFNGAAPPKDAPSYFFQICQVRQAAFTRFPNVSKVHYASLLALHLWKVNAVEEWPVGSVRRIIAAIAASLKYLETPPPSE